MTANQVLEVVEPANALEAPSVDIDPVGGTFKVGDELRLAVEASGNPEPVVVWEKDGEAIPGAQGYGFRIKKLTPYDAGEYRAVITNSQGAVYSATATVKLEIDVEKHSVARVWNEFMLDAIRKDFPDPTKHARNLYHVSAAMWDAFWAYEVEAWTKAKPMFHREDVLEGNWEGDRLAAQREAISHAAFTVLNHRYKDSPGAERSLYGFRWLMERLGFDPDNLSTEGMSPAAVGNRIGKGVLDENYDDGSNELNDYADTSGYEAVNDPLVLDLSGTQMNDINRWQPLAFDYAVSQNGIPIGTLTQEFLGVNWREVETFALAKTSSKTIAFDPGPPPLFGTDMQDEFIDSAVQVIRFSSFLDPADGEMINISPSTHLNNTLGANDGTGRSINPYTGEAYAPNRVKRADYGRILAEFWADGPASETPPGHWNTLHNQVSEHPLFERRYMGVGPELGKLEWDVRTYLALNGGMHDAAVAAWTLKRQYDYSRPISMIRALAGKGQSSDPSLPSYDEDGLPLIPGLIELITAESSALGARHEHLDAFVGDIAIRAWTGEPSDPHNEVGGVGWILAEEWFPYQRSTFVTPAFGAYVSGHSTFSRAGAEIMTLLTGSPFFPGGLGEYHFPKSEFLEFEDGPSEDVTLQWATYYDAADQAGISRLYGGIHVRADDFVGRVLGARIGVEAFLKAHTLGNAVSGTGFIEKGALLQGAEKGGAVLARIESAQGPLPLRGISQTLPQDGVAGVYVVAPGGAEDGRKLRIIGQGGEIVGMEVERALDAGGQIDLELLIATEEPIVLLARGVGPSLGGGVTDTELAAYRKDGAAWVEIDRNDDWGDHDAASRNSVLLMRGAPDAVLAEKEAAIPLLLSSGHYKIELRATGSAGRAKLALRGHSWKNESASH